MAIGDGSVWLFKCDNLKRDGYKMGSLKKRMTQKKLLIFPFSHFLSLLTFSALSIWSLIKEDWNSRKKKKENFTAAINCTMQMRRWKLWKIYDENSYSWTSAAPCIIKLVHSKLMKRVLPQRLTSIFPLSLTTLLCMNFLLT